MCFPEHACVCMHACACVSTLTNSRLESDTPTYNLPICVDKVSRAADSQRSLHCSNGRKPFAFLGEDITHIPFLPPDPEGNGHPRRARNRVSSVGYPLPPTPSEWSCITGSTGSLTCVQSEMHRCALTAGTLTEIQSWKIQQQISFTFTA